MNQGENVPLSGGKIIARRGVESAVEVITVYDEANDACPRFQGGRNRRHRSTLDPAGVQGDAATRLAAFCSARDSLRARIERALLVNSGSR